MWNTLNIQNNEELHHFIEVLEELIPIHSSVDSKDKLLENYLVGLSSFKELYFAKVIAQLVF